jgi:hypothetical protein
MNRRQRIARALHCRLASETIRPDFAYRKGLHSIVLTVNSGYE